MALAGEPEVGGADAAAVVAHANELETTAANVDANGGRSGIERVLDQLFDDRCRPLDRLSGGDTRRDPDRKHANSAGG
jgi:hypothetical protein